ncbi:hypothetical protein ACFXDE_16090 [Kitasatospora sp. NPDC059408]|uniref:hypothetical protein n=1 Tax=Kitasatospora sp. NPDC059408 TaxID=3346823 RepID=UPI0036B6545A
MTADDPTPDAPPPAPLVAPGMDPLGDLVLAVRGSGPPYPDYELPLTVSLDDACMMLGIYPSDGLVAAKAGTFPIDVIKLGTRFRVSTAVLIRKLGLEGVRDAIRLED